MPLEKQPFYDPVPPTYDEAVAGSSRREAAWADEDHGARAEAQSLLPHAESSAGSSRGYYRSPTVETDDEDSLLGSRLGDDDDDDDDDDEAAQVRREMQEMDIEEPSHSRTSSWGKRIGLRLSLPRWKWSWRPRLPRLRLQLPLARAAPVPAAAAAADDDAAPGPPGNDAAPGHGDGEARAQTRRAFNWPSIDRLTLVLVFARVVALFIVLGFLYFLFASGIFGTLSSRLNGGMRFDADDLRTHIQRSIDPMRLRASVQHYSHYAHIAGTEGDYATAMDMESMFSRAGLDKVEVDEYYVYLNYPTPDGRAVQIMDPAGRDAVWTAKLDEEERGGETAGRQTLAFHGHARSGDVRGPLVYANYGSRQDFERLEARGIDTRGAVALVRCRGGGDAALQVKAAELAGCAGCLVYTDPADDGFVRGAVAPDGPYMPADAVRRDSVSLTGWVVGDVLTPGWESKKKRPRIKVNETAGLARIPSLPLAWRDAQVLLQHLAGHGERAPEAWQGGVPGVEWWTGNGSSSPVVRLRNEQDELEQQPIWNVYGRIVGMEQTDRSILLGNHRDAWAFGATDPHSGTAIMVELARIFGDLVARGWRPLRTIEFMSWDGTGYNLAGSTEYVENNLERLRAGAYAYINLDAAVSGPELRAVGSPVLERALLRALDRVVDPATNASLRQAWKPSAGGHMGGPPGAGDCVPFQHLAGTSSLDVSFAGAAFPRHSSYDDFGLVEAVTDPGFGRHALLAQVVGLVLLDLADRAVLPLGVVAYAEALAGWARGLAAWAEGRGANGDAASALPLRELEDAAALVKSRAEAFEKWELEWDHLVLQSAGWEANDLGARRMAFNDKMAALDTALLDLELGGGIPNRTQFKHVVFGPQRWQRDDGAFFPAIRDAVEAGEWPLARQLAAKTAAMMRKAAVELQMER